MSNWLRPDAVTSPDRSFCHTYPRGRGQAQMIPGWPYSFVAALEAGPTSWTALLDAVRLHADDDATDMTATQLRRVITTLISAGHHRTGDPDILVVMDAGFDVVRLAWLLDDLPVTLIARLRSDRVFYALSRHATGTDQGPATAPRVPAGTRRSDHPPRTFLRQSHRYRALRACAGGCVRADTPEAGRPQRLERSWRAPTDYRGHRRWATG